MMLIDTHTHLYDAAFDEDREAAVARAEAAGVGAMLLPAVDAVEYGRQEALAVAHPALFRQMMGLHPTSVPSDWQTALEPARRLLFACPDKYVAVGEIGLDFYWSREGEEAQRSALRQQLLWAQQLGKPVSLHLRSAKDGSADACEAFFELLSELSEGLALSAPAGCAVLRGVMHCFSGSTAQAWRGVNKGFLLGIGGVVSYKHSSMAEVASAIPLSHLVLETDAPYLAPVPHRGKRNESAYLQDVAQCVANIKHISVEEVAAVTTANARRLFDLGV